MQGDSSRVGADRSIMLFQMEFNVGYLTNQNQNVIQMLQEILRRSFTSVPPPARGPVTSPSTPQPEEPKKRQIALEQSLADSSPENAAPFRPLFTRKLKRKLRLLTFRVAEFWRDGKSKALAFSCFKKIVKVKQQGRDSNAFQAEYALFGRRTAEC